MHPREPRTSRRSFLLGVGAALGATSGLGAAAGRSLAGIPLGPGGIPLARRDHPVTLPLYGDNKAIGPGKRPEKGPLQVFNWDAYVNPAVVRAFEKQYGVSVEITTFENEEEAIAKLASRAVQFDVWFATVEYLGKAVAGKLIQPLDHAYLTNIGNVWPSLASPFYDVGSRYSVPYVVYTTGIAWRRDKVKAPTTYRNPYDIFWNARSVSGKLAVIDDVREALGMALLRRHVANVNTEDPSLIARAGADLAQLTKLDNVKVNQTDYQDIPSGATWITQAYSGDMATAASYMPKGVPVSVVGFWRPDKGGMIGSDMITILRGSKRPVLAHHFLNYLLDRKHAIENFSWLGYVPPQRTIDPDSLVAKGYVPGNLRSTIVRESEFVGGKSLLPLTIKGETLWQDAWSKFKAGA
ncbi:MAG TPA: spermidine/putrescine ABC transporter substrate-binding protein [Gaiellaceae bacterium]|nr:spermidine/putrescine ABC transporter substrate-binding protein [Gaiellaceae bacterium]